MSRSVLILIVSLLLSSVLNAQNNDPYALLTEPYLNRPLTIHKGFLQIHGSYSQFNGSKYFDHSGNRLSFAESLRTMSENRYAMSLSYGIIEYLEFTCGLSYRSKIESDPTTIISNYSSVGYENTTYITKGISTLNPTLKYQIPGIITGLGLSVDAGLLIPISSSYPKMPDHSITLLNPLLPESSYTLDSKYFNLTGLPGLFYSSGVNLQYVIEKLGLFIDVHTHLPFSEIETYYWQFRRENEDFDYYKSEYTLMPKGLVYGEALIQAQIYPWFAIYAGYQFNRETAGWSDATNQAVSLSRSNIDYASLGFEIQISTHLRIMQRVNIPVYGNNSFSEFNVSVGVAYNIIPLENLYY